MTHDYLTCINHSACLFITVITILILLYHCLSTNKAHALQYKLGFIHPFNNDTNKEEFICKNKPFKILILLFNIFKHYYLALENTALQIEDDEFPNVRTLSEFPSKSKNSHRISITNEPQVNCQN